MPPALRALQEQTRPHLLRHAAQRLAAARTQYGEFPHWARSVFDTFGTSIPNSKLVRSTLVLTAWKARHTRLTETVLDVALAIELLHTGLLIHDDIMDGDTVRRGAPTPHAHYEREARKRHARTPEQVGSALGMCAGDVAFFYALELLSSALGTTRGRHLTTLIAHTLVTTGFGQMEDVALGSNYLPASERGITAMLRYKTARYTFGLPLCAGALLAGEPPAVRTAYEQLGDHVGLLFQLRDDTLGIYGTPATTGKPVGADIREGKKTLHWWYLMQRAPVAARRKLGTIYGNPRASGADITYVRSALATYKVEQQIERIAQREQRAALEILVSMRIPAHTTTLLHELVTYVSTRER